MEKGTEACRNILVVDDDDTTRQMIVDALGYTGGFSILEASNGEEALRQMKDYDCDLVITDVMMPVMGGMELLNQVMEINPLTHVIVITGFPNVDLSVAAMKSGAVDFLVKPFSIKDLLYKVEICLRERSLIAERAVGERADFVLKNKLRELSTRSYIYDMIEGTSDSNDRIFHEMVDAALKISGGESCSLLLFDEDSNEFHPKIIKNLKSDFLVGTPPAPLLDKLSVVVQKKEGILINSFTDPGAAGSFLLAPLKIRNQVFGILSLCRRKNGLEFTKTDLNYVLTLAKRASLNLENNILYESTYANLMHTFRSLATSIQARDHYTESHSVRVTALAVKTADVMGCTAGEIESLRISGMLHDIGKIAIPDSILLKPDRLTDEEYDIIKRHPVTGETIIKPILLFDKERGIIRHHHERWDGRGYPDGMAGLEIPRLARILAVADSFDAMTNNRPYRKAMKTEKAVAELEKNAGLQFDEEVVNGFLKVIAAEQTPKPH
jgi:response regulator RpfG family c-di-GMP phosphodiesterase